MQVSASILVKCQIKVAGCMQQPQCSHESARFADGSAISVKGVFSGGKDSSHAACPESLIQCVIVELIQSLFTMTNFMSELTST